VSEVTWVVIVTIVADMHHSPEFRRRGITQKKAYNFISSFSFALCLLSTCAITVHAHDSRFIWFGLRSHLIRNINYV